MYRGDASRVVEPFATTLLTSIYHADELPEKEQQRAQRGRAHRNLVAVVENWLLVGQVREPGMILTEWSENKEQMGLGPHKYLTATPLPFVRLLNVLFPVGSECGDHSDSNSRYQGARKHSPQTSGQIPSTFACSSQCVLHLPPYLFWNPQVNIPLSWVMAGSWLQCTF